MHVLPQSVIFVTSVALAVVPFLLADSQPASARTGSSPSALALGAHPTRMPTSVHTATPTAAPGATATPTAAPDNGATINGVPLCGDHNPTQWHPLLKRNADGSINCTYGHEHGANPTAADAVFGPLPLKQQISYPWATLSSSGVPENGPDIKHRMYKWLVATNLPCTDGAADGSNKIVTALREELHADGNLGAAVRFHSYWGQYQLTDCATGENGSLYMGGHMDYARLTVGELPLPLADDPPPGCVTNGDGRQEGALNQQEQISSVWYGTSSRPPGCDNAYGFGPFVSVAVGVGTDGWGPVDPANPTSVQFYPDRERHHGTGIATDSLTLWISEFTPDASGHVNFTGHVNRIGTVVPEVPGKPEGTDYIALVIRNAKPGAYGGLSGGAIGWDGDVSGPRGQAGYYVETPRQP